MLYEKDADITDNEKNGLSGENIKQMDLINEPYDRFGACRGIVSFDSTEMFNEKYGGSTQRYLK